MQSEIEWPGGGGYILDSYQIDFMSWPPIFGRFRCRVDVWAQFFLSLIIYRHKVYIFIEISGVEAMTISVKMLYINT